MAEYSELVRARIVGPGAVAATELSRETGISQATLSRPYRNPTEHITKLLTECPKGIREIVALA